MIGYWQRPSSVSCEVSALLNGTGASHQLQCRTSCTKWQTLRSLPNSRTGFKQKGWRQLMHASSWRRLLAGQHCTHNLQRHRSISSSCRRCFLTKTQRCFRKQKILLLVCKRGRSFGAQHRIFVCAVSLASAPIQHAHGIIQRLAPSVSYQIAAVLQLS